MSILDEDTFDYQVLSLTPSFYADYPNPPYREIIRKESRPYNCLLIQSRYGYFIAIPYRSHINHKYSYRFKNSVRSRQTKSGLDFTKLVIITNPQYLGTTTAIVDNDEYRETVENLNYIKQNVLTYIDNYIVYISDDSLKRNKQLERTYKYSTLQYFHQELGILNS